MSAATTTNVPYVTLIGSWWGVFFAGIMAVITGLSMGASELMMAPVKIMDVAPGGLPKEVLFVRGSEQGGTNWNSKVETFLSEGPREVIISEAELNGFARRAFESPGAAKGVTVTPNVAISARRLQLSLIIYTDMLQNPIIFQTRGEFAKSGEGYSFAPQVAYFGRLPLPKAFTAVLVNAFFEKTFSSLSGEPFKKAWGTLSGITIEGRSLKMSLR